MHAAPTHTNIAKTLMQSHTNRNNTDLFEERADVPPDAPRRPDAVYLYGVDVLSTRDVLSYFGDFAPTFVEWINDSACE